MSSHHPLESNQAPRQYAARERVLKTMGGRRAVWNAVLATTIAAPGGAYIMHTIDAGSARLTPGCELSVRQGETGWDIANKIQDTISPLPAGQSNDPRPILGELQRTGTNQPNVIDDSTYTTELPIGLCAFASIAYPGNVTYLPGFHPSTTPGK